MATNSITLASQTVGLVVNPIEYTVTIARIGPQGPRGVAGAAGASGATNVVGTAGTNVSGHVAVMYSGAGLLVPADASILSHLNKVVGITLNAALNGADLTIQGSGIVEHMGWAFTPDQPVFLGLSGSLTQSMAGLLFALPVGIAVSATKLIVNIQPAIVLG